MFMTANPSADAERWENEQDRQEQEREAEQIQARATVLNVLSKTTPDMWFKDLYFGGTYTSADEMLVDALESDEVVQNAYAALLASPEAKALHATIAAYHGTRYWAAINHV